MTSSSNSNEEKKLPTTISPPVPPKLTIKAKTHPKLIKTLHNSLNEAQKSINTHQVVEKSYGDDASIFAETPEAATTMLANLITDVMDKVNTQAKADIEQICSTHVNGTFESMMLTFDKVIQEQRHADKLEIIAEEKDKQSVREALQRAKLPKGVTIEQILEYQAYQMKCKVRDELLADIEGVDEENLELERLLEEKKKKVQGRIDVMDDSVKALDRTADLCSFNGVS